MACSILTEDRWSQLLDGRLSKEEKALIFDHLEDDCPDCEYLFERMTDEEEMQLRTVFNEKVAQQSAQTQGTNVTANPGHLSAAKARPESGRSEGFFGRLFGSIQPAPVWAGGFAVMTLVVVGLMGQMQGVNGLSTTPSEAMQHAQFDKGLISADPSINLQFAIGHSSDKGGAFTVNRGTIGEQVSASDRLFLHYDVASDGYVYIFGLGPGNAVTVISPGKSNNERRLSAGSYDVMQGEQLNGMSLSDIQGRYTVVGVHSAKPIDELENLITVIQQAVDERTGSVDESILNSTYKDIGISVVYFDVAA